MDEDLSKVQIVDAILPASQRNVSQEFQILSKPGSRITYVAGVFLYQSTAAYNDARIAGAAIGGTVDINGSQRTRSAAAYAQLTYELSDKTRLTGGLRYTLERQRFKTGVNGTTLPDEHRGYSKPTWRLALDHAFAPDVRPYVSYNRGVKGGGFDLLTPGNKGFAPETLDAYEVGLKSELFDRRLRLNASLFRYDYKNIQVQINPAGTVVTTNAASARINGADADFEVVPVRNLTLSGGATWLDGKYQHFPNAISYPSSPLDGGATNVDASGNQTVSTPKFTANGAVRYKIESQVGLIDLTTSVSYNSGFQFAAANNFRQDSYTLLNASAGWTTPNGMIGIQAFANNITKSYYYTQGIVSGLGHLIVPAAPRTYGMRLTVKM